MIIGPFWEVPGGFTNTGLCAVAGNFAIGDFTNGKIVFADIYGNALGGDITLASAPIDSVQGVAHNSATGDFWVCHYAATNGTIRRYNASGALQQTISPGIAVAGPNGCCYDSVNDRILTAWNDDSIRGYSCSTGTLVETITIDATWIGADPADGVTFDPTEPIYLWVTCGANKIAKIWRSTGTKVASYLITSDIESMAFMDGYIYVCHDLEFHSAVPNGNRVYRYDVSSLLPKAIWPPESLFGGI